jgi:hypothetical protein
MGAAEDLFATLQGFKNPDGKGRSPETILLEYCANELGSVERLHFDYKEKADSRTSDLAQLDKVHMAKAVSGFANSSGGVLIWGIEDETMNPKPIAFVREFVSNIQKGAPLWVEPVVAGIDGCFVEAASGAGAGYAIIYVPESVLPPHRVVLKDREVQDRYYLRSGEDFVVASHTMLEDMFGRRPKPLLALLSRVLGPASSRSDFAFMISIENRGRGVARGPFLELKVHNPYVVSIYGIDGNMRDGLEKVVVAMGSEVWAYGGNANTLIHSGVTRDIARVVLPDMRLVSFATTPALIIEYKMAAEGLPLTTGRVFRRGDDIEREWEASKHKP